MQREVWQQKVFAPFASGDARLAARAPSSSFG
jgi:hypothetical protein